MKNFWLVCKKLRRSINIYSHFQLVWWSLFAFLKVAIWFHFSENDLLIFSDRRIGLFLHSRTEKNFLSHTLLPHLEIWCAAQKRYLSLQLLLGVLPSSAVHGFYEKKGTEENSASDVYAIKTVTESNQIVGHLPREISRMTKCLLDRGAKISLTLTSTNYRSPLVQGWLEIPCKVTDKLSAMIKNHMIRGRYEELVRELYFEQKEEVMGSFLALTTGPVPGPSKVNPRKFTKRTKQMKEPARYRDISDMFKAGRQGKGITRQLLK